MTNRASKKSATSAVDPYEGNLLVKGLGPIPSPKDALQRLIHLPRMPEDVCNIPPHVRTHFLFELRDLHVPPLIERQLLQTIDLMIRQGYRYRNPLQPSTWAAISGEAQHFPRLVPTAFAAAVEGISGVGKTQGCMRSLRGLSCQTIRHEKFPRLAKPFLQVVWLSVEVPASGKAVDLARAFMTAWDEATGGDRFEDWLAKDRISNGLRALDEWRQVAVSHFLGVLHLDEVQNLFKLASLEKRSRRKNVTDSPELSIVEDQVLRWLLYLTNSGTVPLLVSGTPDGIGALSKRMSTLQRLNTCGYHPFLPFLDAQASEFRNSFLGVLGRYQYVENPLVVDDEFASLLVDLTGGVQRIIIALWIAAHRTAYERGTDDLRPDDFIRASRTWLAPLAPAIAALRSGDPRGLARYEDLARSDSALWAEFWSNMQVA